MKAHQFSVSLVAFSLLASSIVAVDLDAAVNVVPASRNRDPGSIAALLDHISAQGRKALPVNMIPDAFKAKPKDPSDNDTPVVKNPKNPKNPKLVDATLNIQARNVEPSAEERRAFLDGMSGRMAKKRWVWGTSILQDDPQATGVPGPPIGPNVNGFSNSAVVNPPPPTMIAPSFPPLPKPTASSSAPPVVGPPAPFPSPSPLPTVMPVKNVAPARSSSVVLRSSRAPRIQGRGDSGCPKVYITDNQQKLAGDEQDKKEKEKKEKEKNKRWIWATSILQDDDFTPPAGQPTIGGINSPGAEATPTAIMVPPTFPPIPPAPIVAPPPLPVATPLPDKIAATVVAPPVNPKVTATSAAMTPTGRIKFVSGSVVAIPNPKLKTSTLILPTAPVKIVIPVVPHPGAPIWTKTIVVQPGITHTAFGVTPTTAPAPGILPRHAGADPRRVDHQRMIKRKDPLKAN